MWGSEKNFGSSRFRSSECEYNFVRMRPKNHREIVVDSRYTQIDFRPLVLKFESSDFSMFVQMLCFFNLNYWVRIRAINLKLLAFGVVLCFPAKEQSRRNAFERQPHLRHRSKKYFLNGNRA
jgi:hypothetical protein